MLYKEFCDMTSFREQLDALYDCDPGQKHTQNCQLYTVHIIFNSILKTLKNYVGKLSLSLTFSFIISLVHTYTYTYTYK